MNTIKNIHWGIIGCGDVCEVKSGPAFNLVDHSSLVAVMRRNGALAQDFARRHNVSRWYDDAEALLSDKDVSAIYIATPPASHEHYAIEAIKKGKPVYVEKPVALDVASCERMIDAARTYGTKVSVAHYRRALPLFTKVRETIHAGKIGKPLHIRCTTLQASTEKTLDPNFWRTRPELSGGGLFFDLAPHQLDLFCWLFGAPVWFEGTSLNQSGRYSAPDLTSVQAQFPHDVYLHALWGFNNDPSCDEDLCEITGDKGKLVFSFFKPSPLTIITSTTQEVIEVDFPAHIQQPMIQQVVRYFQGESENPCSLEEALLSLQMMEKANRPLVIEE
jgi:1,5-anhydro-D-fructose reductase (1,5-anhydro-D-mannitol-forming)